MEFVLDGRTWQLGADCLTTYNTRLPVITLYGLDERLAHVGHNRQVCVTDAQGLSIDPERWPDVVGYTIDAAVQLIGKSLLDAQQGSFEFYDELEGYWTGLPNLLLGRADIDVEGEDRFITSFVETLELSRRFIFTEVGATQIYGAQLEKLTPRRSLFLKLGAMLPPPVPGKPLGADYLDDLVSILDDRQRALWKDFLDPSKKKPREPALLLSFPRPAGGRSLVGVSFVARDGRVDRKGPFYPIICQRQSVPFMRERGCASLGLMGKHVVVFGCGAVGSEVADALASSGVGKLTLVDPDLFEADNVFRHVLEPHWIGCPKADSLACQLERRYPGLNATAVRTLAEEWLKVSNLTNVDGIVLALGLPTLERELSRKLRALDKAVPVVVTWLEPLDLGGHAVLLSTKGQGCLDCLYRAEDGTPSQQSRTAFLVPGQPVTRNLTGCASYFVPFGAIQSRRTALMAAELMVGALSSVNAPSYRYWVGEGSSAKEQGLNATPWWTRAKKVQAAQATASVFAPPCPNCREPH